MESTLNTLRANKRKLSTCFEIIREDIISKLNECNDYIRMTDTLYDQAIQINADLENKLVNVSKEEKKWQGIKRKLATTLHTGVVTLNVGGERYTTSVDTLTKEENTFFTALFSEQWELSRNPNDGSIFIDRNGELFKHILEYFRTESIPSDILTNELLRQLLIKEAEFFGLPDLIYKLTEPDRRRQEEEERLAIERTFPNGTLLRLEHTVKLNEFYGNINQRWELIYKATRDGFTANAFHVRCDNEGPTMTIIQSNNNYIFGGYISISWASSGGFQDDLNAFLFTLTNPHNIPPTKYTIQSEWVGYAIQNSTSSGPVFGCNHDIYIADNSNSNNSSRTNFSGTYNDTTGKGVETFTGAFNFTTSEIEVYKLA
ncbi:unnamed protein product [Adineta steineri]|uniref:TLDc domain-containing protein n=1 Tax=Adineta steineri TaxID=433720 RepID=A0A813ZR21_9BILA|nr:unnamed protein product [Adineta steineri]CAF3729872.1 unnamed protein product [Adineta steineri]